MSGRTLVRYTIALEPGSSQQSHRLGVNSLAIDPAGSGTLYSAGRDGVIVAWDLQMSLSRVPNRFDQDEDETRVDAADSATIYKQSIQAHTNWVNQIGISPSKDCVYSCSSDALVKVWRPHSRDAHRTDNLGSHTDYIKCLAVPKFSNEWIATAGLDRTILTWDTSGKGERLRIDDSTPDGTMKQSVYSLATGPNLLITGGIEKVMRVWDCRSAKRITKLIGHTDNVRSILCSDDGRKVISASSDSTIKIWDLVAGRCLHTLSVHSDPVWTLISDHPNLAVFHAGDKAGLVTKTDLRSSSGDGSGEGECIAVCREDSGINSLSLLGDRLFTATSKSSINRWLDTETEANDPFADPDDLPVTRVESTTSSNRRLTNLSNTVRRPSSLKPHAKPNRIALGIQNGLANTDPLRRSSLYSSHSVVSLATSEKDDASATSTDSLAPLRAQPEATIAGQAGLIAHSMLSDRTRVLTRDTDGKIKLWDITQCKLLRDFGVADIDEVQTRLQSPLAIGNWCSVNTKVGALTVELDPRNVFDAETYFDSVAGVEKRDAEYNNQRFNVGRWMLHNLFKSVIDAEINRDRKECARYTQRRPGKLDLSNLALDERSSEELTPDATKSPMSFQSKNPYGNALNTPGLSMGLTTPMPVYSPRGSASHQHHGSLSSIGSSNPSSPVVSADYFSNNHGSKDADATPQASNEPTTPGSMPKTPGGSLMKNMKWLRSSKPTKVSSDLKRTSSNTQTTPLPAPTPTIEVAPKNFKEFVERQRKDFSTKAAIPQAVKIGQTPSVASWIKPLEPSPVLQLPPSTEISLAYFQPGEGEAKDMYRGTISTIARDLDACTEFLPTWLAQVLLLNDIPAALQNNEANKHYFSFVPHANTSLQDPFNTSPPNLMRLGAARSLRIRKALTYISQRLPQDLVEREGQKRAEEEWLEIVVGGTSVDPDWTLFMTRRHLWKQGGDMKLEYRLKREAV